MEKRVPRKKERRRREEIEEETVFEHLSGEPCS